MPVETRSKIAPQATNPDSVLFGLVQRLADNKYWLGRRYAEWCNSAPTLESAVAASAMAQDEIGHARSHYPLFRQFVGHEVEPEDRVQFYSMTWLDRQFESWLDFVTANFVVDSALTVLFEAARDSRYIDLRTRARRILGEEQIHWLHGQGWVRRLSRESDRAREALRDAISGPWQEALMWFGRDESTSSFHLIDAGILSESPAQLRQAHLGRLEPVLTAADIAVPSSSDALPWDRWDDERYRLRGV